MLKKIIIIPILAASMLVSVKAGAAELPNSTIASLAKKITVTLKNNSTILEKIAIDKDTLASALKLPEKEGYIATIENKIDKIISDITLNVKYIPKSVKTVFHINIPGDTRTYSETYTYDKTNQSFGMGLTNKTGDFGTWKREGYVLAGWSNGIKTWPTYSGVINRWIDIYSGTIDLYAVWKPKTHKVTFIDDVGKVLKEQIVNYGKNATAPTNVQKPGYVFKGWDKTFNNITKNLTVKAVYDYDLQLRNNKWVHIGWSGRVVSNYTGMTKNKYGWWRMVNGKIDFGRDEVMYVRVNGKREWRYLHNGKVQENFTGLASNAYGTFYFKNGKIVKDFEGMIEYNGFKYKIVKGAFSHSVDYQEKNEEGNKYNIPKGRRTYIIGDSRTAHAYSSIYRLNDFEKKINGRTEIWPGWRNGNETGWAQKGLTIWKGLTTSKYQYMADALNNLKVDNVTDVMIFSGFNDTWDATIVQNGSKPYVNPSTGSTKTPPEEYVKLINAKAKEFREKGARVYYVSVLPCENNAVKLENVKRWNTYMKNNLSSDVRYINMSGIFYSSLMPTVNGKRTHDGVHFWKEGSIKLWQYAFNHKNWY